MTIREIVDSLESLTREEFRDLEVVMRGERDRRAVTDGMLTAAEIGMVSRGHRIACIKSIRDRLGGGVGECVAYLKNVLGES